MVIVADPPPPIYTLSDYRELLQALGTGQLRVKYQDREVWYKSNAEMLQAKRIMEGLLGLTAPAPSRRFSPAVCKGLG